MVRNVLKALECGIRWTLRNAHAGSSQDAVTLARQQSSFFASTSSPTAYVTHYMRVSVRHVANPARPRSTAMCSLDTTAAFVSAAAREAAQSWAIHARSAALPWRTKVARAVWQSIPRLLVPPKMDITGSLWNMALASPKLMSNPAALCTGLPFIREARYYIRTFDGLRAQHMPQFPTRAQIDAALRRSMDLLQSYTSTLSTSSLCTTLITSMNIVGKNHALMLGIIIAEALNRNTSDCLAPPVVIPTRTAYEELTFNWFDPTLTWGEWADVVFREMRESVLNMLHVVHLLVLFTPVALCAPLALYWGWGRASWLEKLRQTLEAAGPAFIKWGQWAATRQDMFPNDMCRELALLQVRAPSHKFAYTKRTLEESFGTRVEDLFDWLEEEPVASGSVGQVHRGKLSKRGAEICGMSGVHEGKVVAVKVKHPGVSASIQRDFGLMMWAAHWLEWYPMLRKMRLQESLSQFAAPLREQVDLSFEANNLWRFNQNFCKDERVSLPVPLYPWVSQDVLVESFEEGMHISTYMDMDSDTRRRAAVADVGSATMLNMMLVHNLIHSDLHPGNILVRWQLPRGWIVSAAARLLQAFNSDPTKVMNGWLQPHVVLLDVGMATELSNDDRYNMFHLFKGFAEKDGKKMAAAALAFAGKEQRCIDPEGFQQEISRACSKMSEIVSIENWEDSDYSNSAAAFSSVLDTVREYEVTLPGHICAVLVTTLVLEGWSSELAPDHSVLEEVKSLVANDNKNWRERLNMTVDQLMGWSPVLPSLDAA